MVVRPPGRCGLFQYHSVFPNMLSGNLSAGNQPGILEPIRMTPLGGAHRSLLEAGR